MVVAISCAGEHQSCHGVLQRELQGECEFEGGRRHDGEDDCQVGEASEERGRKVGRRGRGGGRGGDGSGGGGGGGEGFQRGGEREGGGRGREEARIRGGVHEGGDASSAARPAAESQDAAAGEAGASHEARHGTREHEAGELRGREPALPPDLGESLSSLRIAELPHEGRARDAGESHAAPEDDDAQPRSVATPPRPPLSVESEFAHHQPGLARLNNGSFGSCPKSVLAAQEAASSRWLRQPDERYFGLLEQDLHRARQEVADMIRAPVEEVFFVENVTAAASMVAMDVMWAFAEGRYNKGDSILMLNFTYGALKKAFQAYAARAGGRVFQVVIPFPVSSEEEILHTFEDALKKESEEHSASKIRLAVFDHIVSMPTMILPIRKLVKLCRRYGVESIFIDGAHGIGNLELDMKDIDADYYTSNLHKWMFASSTAAFVHCKAQHLARLHHPVVSLLHGDGIVAECSWVGTRDYSALVAVPEAIQFVKDVAGSVEEYSRENHCNVVAMAEMLASAWGTFLGTPPEMCAAMAMVALPPAVNVHSQAELLTLRRRIREEYHVEVHLFYAGNSSPTSDEAAPGGRLRITTYVRISHQIYNKTDEYIKLRDAINDMALKS